MLDLKPRIDDDPLTKSESIQDEADNDDDERDVLEMKKQIEDEINQVTVYTEELNKKTFLNESSIVRKLTECKMQILIFLFKKNKINLRE